MRPLVAVLGPRASQTPLARGFPCGWPHWEGNVRRPALFHSPTCRRLCTSSSDGASDHIRIITQIADVPNPKQSDKSNWISDPHGYLKAADKRAINVLIKEMHFKYGVEVAVIVIDALVLDVRPFLKSLFNDWGVGCKSASNGVLLAMIMGKKRLEIVTGDGLDASALDKITVEEIHEAGIMPAFNDGRIAEGLRLGLVQIAQKLEEWPDRSFAAEWVATGGEHDGRSFSGGFSSIQPHEDPRFLGPERVTMLALGACGIAGAALYIEDWYYERDRKRCPACGQWELKRHTETVIPMTCNPWQAGKKCEHTICQACGHHDKKSYTVPAAHAYSSTCARLRKPTYEAEGLEQITNTCRTCGAVETSERVVPKLMKRKQHAGI